MKPLPAIKPFLQSWGPALLLMAAIFLLSSRPSTHLPQFGWADAVIKKSGHVIGYGLLGLCYRRALEWRPGRDRIAWALAVLYGITDELHQAFVPGRQPSAWDVLLFDAPGAAIALWRGRLRALASKAGQ